MDDARKLEILPAPGLGSLIVPRPSTAASVASSQGHTSTMCASPIGAAIHDAASVERRCEGLPLLWLAGG